MIEKIYKFTDGDENVIEKIIADDNIHYMHMILNKDQGLPKHSTNSNVYMTVLRGKLTLSLNGEKANLYEKGTVINIPINTKMDAINLNDEILELTVVKAPAPLM